MEHEGTPKRLYMGKIENPLLKISFGQEVWTFHVPVTTGALTCNNHFGFDFMLDLFHARMDAKLLSAFVEFGLIWCIYI